MKNSAVRFLLRRQGGDTKKQINYAAPRKKSRNPPADGLPFSRLADAVAAFKASGNGVGPEWDPYRKAYFNPPDWLDGSLDPLSPEYQAQQLRLWSEITEAGQPYDPDRFEQTPDAIASDFIKRPAYFAARHREAVRLAAEHILACGHILAHSGLQPGGHAIEYGAGYGQIALTLARLGVHVDTVDISPEFCEAVRAQAQFLGVDLGIHLGRFGDNPQPGRRYDLALFYESFHHCLDFTKLIETLGRDILTPDGRVILGGEPVVEEGSPIIPYPWGIRLDASNVVIVRIRGWMELGFQEPFLMRMFTERGFAAARHDIPGFHYPRLYTFTRSPVGDRSGLPQG